MPLQDHFHAPLHPQRHWEAFHSRWASALADSLNDGLLPPTYFAEPETHANGRVEIDVAAFEGTEAQAPGGNGATATLTKCSWSPPAPALLMPAVFPGSFRVQVFRNNGGAVLVGAIELVSPANKDRSTERRAFATKCANYLYQGVGLVVVDIVTNRHANLHNEVIDLMQAEAGYRWGNDQSLYAVAYRPVRQESGEQIAIWPVALNLGQALPILPLYLASDLCLPIALETTYDEACRRLRLR